jgi:predicted kinase
VSAGSQPACLDVLPDRPGDPESKSMSQQLDPQHQEINPCVPKTFLTSVDKLATVGALAGPNHDGPTGSAALLLMVGLPGSGKTTWAKKLAAAHRALRMTPDEWMISLFGEPEADGKRDLLEGRLIALALRALHLGTNVVLDFGLWSRDERSALRWLAASAGAVCHVIYLPVAADVQRTRIAHRQATAPHTTFPMSQADIDAWRKQFQAPDAAELEGDDIAGPPQGWPDWTEWAADRWPSLAAE